jgi:hypothetical protein
MGPRRTPLQSLQGLRWSLRSRWADHASYLEYSRRRHPLSVVNSETELVIEGYMRSANTFSTVAFQTSQPSPVRLAHHLHAPAQIIAGVKMGIPVLVPVRPPRDAAVSVTIRSPHVSLQQALDAHRRFHEAILPYRDACYVALFDDVIADFCAVVSAMNTRLGTNFTPFHHTPENVQRVYAIIEERARRPAHAQAIRGYVSGITPASDFEEARAGHTETERELPEHRVARPSDRRRAQQEAVRELYEAPGLARLREQADAAYRRFAYDD